MDINQELTNNLEKLGFSNLEARIYMVLLENGEMSAYQIAKEIEISRSSIYNALEHMYKKGMVFINPTNTALYMAQKPDALLEAMKLEFKSSVEKLTKGLEEFMASSKEEKFANFIGYETMIATTKKLLLSAEKEVYMNTDFSLEVFQDEFDYLQKKGVRIVVFSFYDLKLKNKEINFYTHNYAINEAHIPGRLQIVADKREALMADYIDTRQFWRGTITNNKLLVSILCEHIHNDIYLLRIRQKYGSKSMDEFLIGTGFERCEW
ncbi:MAG TPA: helix-turn-helix domain-containing protein [Mobilitalea sp.]|nr:helix-turn-helix domain-containing protein [Mobilitalea sp.]